MKIQMGEMRLVPQTQWRSGKFSIVSPCKITSGMYELYPAGRNDEDSVERFSSLKEAKKRASQLINK